MRSLNVVLMILLSFFLHLSANAAELSLAKLDSKLRILNSHFIKDFVAPSQKSNLKQKLVLSKTERKAVVDILTEYRNVFDEVEKRAGDSFLNTGSTRLSEHKRLLAKLMLHSHGAKLFSEILSYPAILGVVSEHDKVGELPVDYIHSLIMKLARGTQKSIRRGGRRNFTELSRPSIADFLSYPREFSYWISQSGLSKEEKYLVQNLMEEYVNSVRSFSRKKNELIKNRILTKYLYKFKASALTWLGDIALPSKNVFGKEYLNKMENLMLPGDIGIVNQDGRLSNLVFTGMWSHGLLFIGRYDQMEEMFSSDELTNQIYEKKCSELKLECSNFLSFMTVRFPESFGKYKKSHGTEHELTVIESNSEGVGLSTTEHALAYNRVTAFRPNLSLKDKAMAIEEAFNNYGKPYDFNFDNRTYGRIVCTELILYSYMPDEAKNKEGLNWFMSVIGGSPAMYGYDVVETFFEIPESQRKVDFLFYYESPRSGQGVTEKTLEDLRNTVEPDMNRFKDSAL